MKEAMTKDFHGTFQKFLERYNKCIAAGGDYFEWGLGFHVCTINKSTHTKKVWKLISWSSYILNKTYLTCSGQLGSVCRSRPPDMGTREAQHSCHAAKIDTPWASRGRPTDSHLFRQSLFYCLAPEISPFQGIPTGPRRIWAMLLYSAPTLKRYGAAFWHLLGTE